MDWGTTQLRAWLMGGEAPILRSSDQGMNRLEPSEFETALLDLIEDHLPEVGTLPVICCGMVGAAQGWREAPYVATPCAPPGARDAVTLEACSGRAKVYILPGVKQLRPADVMRGEETQVGGFLSLNPGWDGIICLPGTHTKWVHVSAGEIVSFQTFLTGELFDLLTTQSVLRHTVVEGTDWTAFGDAVSQAVSRPAQASSELFRIRADALLNGLSGERAYARLSGLLIGAELSAAKPYWLGQRIVVIGSGMMAEGYVQALAAQGVTPERANVTEATLAGLRATYEMLGQLDDL